MLECVESGVAHVRVLCFCGEVALETPVAAAVGGFGGRDSLDGGVWGDVGVGEEVGGGWGDGRGHGHEAGLAEEGGRGGEALGGRHWGRLWGGVQLVVEGVDWTSPGGLCPEA